jgi:hypothetical protein
MKSSCGAILVMAVSLGILTGCASFEREWKRAAAAPAISATTTPQSQIVGRWQGRWQSNRNQHDGALRCVVKPLSNDVYSARFHAKYRRLFNMSFGYTALLQATPSSSGDRLAFTGEADLGWYAGGVYHYEGYADATHFSSTYSSKFDHGTFTLTRPME